MKFINKIFPSYNDKKINEYKKIVENINLEFSAMLEEDKNSPIDAKAKTQAFRERLKGGEDIDSVLPEAFALVKLVMTRMKEQAYRYRHEDMNFTWDMVPYDVQILGGIALHKGTIVEMATGEGKTLVAVMPLYLNSLLGRGSYLITVNDYLAKRDRAWMHPVYDELGVTVGLIQTGMRPAERREQYDYDITYVTNNEFGFDYLRDNITYHRSDRVHRESFYFAIIDEVDSVLIDEARTPLIISGLPMDGSDQKKTYQTYSRLNPSVSRFFSRQRDTVNSIFENAKKQIEQGDYENGIRNLLIVKRGYPKHKGLIAMMQEADVNSQMEKKENIYLRDKIMHTLDKELLYTIEERTGAVNITDRGESEFSRLAQDSDFFILPEMSMLYKEIDSNDDLSDEAKIEKKEEIAAQYSVKSELIHAVHQLLKAYTVFEKDVDYIVQENKVIIVDEHTGRLMPGRRYSEGLHSAIEAKEKVDIEEETRTLATITLQNLFRMFEKLSGMTGTAETESKEFIHIYKLPVLVIPTNRPVIRKDYNDVLFIRKDDKTEFIINRIMKLHNAGIPVLVGTASVDSSEYLDKRLKAKKDLNGKALNYAILNAKHHEKEALIVADAGLQGAVTIATNMAGRGTDIKLGPTIRMLHERSALMEALQLKEHGTACAVVYTDAKSKEYLEHILENDEFVHNHRAKFVMGTESKDSIPVLHADEFAAMNDKMRKIEVRPAEDTKNRTVCLSYDDKGKCIEYAPSGLYVLGTEKHESRRIDRQLRGRSGRQGDPGASLFTVSLEDDLMRIFGSDRMSDLIKRLETMSSEQTAVSHRMLTTSIESAQKKVENLNFERRKYLIEYDDVINKQREVVYDLRDFFLYKVPPQFAVNPEHFRQFSANLTDVLKNLYAKNDIILINKHIEEMKHSFDIETDMHQLKTVIDSNHLDRFISDSMSVRIEKDIEEIKEYILENIVPMAEEFVIETIPKGMFREEWPIERVNEFLMNYFRITAKRPEEDISVEDYASRINDAVMERFNEKSSVPQEYKARLLFIMSMNFIMAIDREWVEQLYELDAVKEGISLRGYATKDPLVEFKKEAYILFEQLMDNIFRQYAERFFALDTVRRDEPEVKEARVSAEKPQVFANSPESGKPVNKPAHRDNRKIGRNDPCPCGSGKKYKNCCGKGK